MTLVKLPPDALTRELAENYLAIVGCNMAPEQLEQHSAKVSAIRSIGRRLHKMGGCELMAKASLQVFRITGEVHPTGAHFNQLWDCVGEWRV